MESKLIHSLVHRLAETLPLHSKLNAAEFLSDALVQQTMLSLVSIGRTRLHTVSKALCSLLDSVHSCESSLLLVLRLLVVVLNGNWQQDVTSPTVTSPALSPTVKFAEAAAVDDKSFSILYAAITRILAKYARLADLSNAFSLMHNPAVAQDSDDFVMVLGVYRDAATALSQPIAAQELYHAAGRMVFYLSASNWEAMYTRLKIKLSLLATASDDSVDASELRVMEWCHLTCDQLSLVLTDISTNLKAFRKPVVLAIPAILKRVIWNWILVFPYQFVNLHESGKRLPGASDFIFEYFSPLADSNKRKSVIWPFLTSLLLTCPDVLMNVANLSSTEGGGDSKKAFQYAYFLETLRQSLKSGKLADVAAQCHVDICKAAVLVKNTNSAGLSRLVADIEDELRRKLFITSKPFLNSDGVFHTKVLIDFLSAFYRRDTELWMKSIPPVFLSDSAPNSFKLVLVKSCALILAQDSSHFWNTPLSNAYSVLANPFRALFHECVDNKQVVEKDKKLKKDEKLEIFEHLLNLYNSDPKLATWNEKVHKHDATRTFLIDLTISVQDGNGQSGEVLGNLFTTDMIESWGSEGHSFWNISSIVLGMISRFLSQNPDDELVRFYNELLLQLLTKRNEYIIKHRDHIEEGLELIERIKCNYLVETGLLVCLCSAHSQISALAIACLEQLCIESVLIDGPPDLELPKSNIMQYSKFLDGAMNSAVTGKVAIQKRVRKMLRNLDITTDGLLDAWSEVYKRWSCDDDLKRYRKGEDKSEWVNYLGFLCALGGSCLIPQDKRVQRSYTGHGSQNLLSLGHDQPPLYSSIEKFIAEILSLLVSDDAVIREAVKEIVGSELSPGLYPILFQQLSASTLQFDTNGHVHVNERLTFHVEQAISVLKLILERQHDHLDDAYAIDFGGLVYSYTKYLNQLGRGSLKIKVKLCLLIEILIQKREIISLREEIKLRNRFLECLISWTSDFSTSCTDDDKLSRDLDNVCFKAIVVLLVQLPLQPTDSHEVENVYEARGRLFYKYFLYFIQVIKRCRIEPSRSNDKDLSLLKENTILALSNLLSANIDSGLKFALAVGYHEDLKTRTAFMQVLANILNQGAEFDGLADTYVTDRYHKMVELMYDSDLVVTLALCDACPTSDLDDLATLLLTTFEAKNQTLKLLKALVDKEVSRTESAPNLFRRNSIATKLITLYAKANGAEYLKTLFDPVWSELMGNGEVIEYEIDPMKLDNVDPAANRGNLQALAAKFLNVILKSADLVPPPLRHICYFLVSSVKDRFPDANMNVVIGGFLFLRFFCPAIVSPDRSLGSLDSKDFRRGLVLVTKIIQNLANNVLFGAKETFMKELNPFLESNNERVAEFLKVLSECESPCESVNGANHTIEDQDLHKLHRYLCQNLENIGHQLTTRKQGHLSTDQLKSVKSMDSVSGSIKSLNITAGFNVSLTLGKKLFDNLSTILAQLGPLPEAGAKENSALNKTSTNQLYIEFMIRNEGRNINAIKESRFFFEAGVSKLRRPVFYYIARRLNSSAIDMELVIYSILHTIKPSQDNPFDIVIDLTQFREENECQNEWISQFMQIVPHEASVNLGSVYIFNANSAFKKFSKRLNRFVSNKYAKKIILINSMHELHEYISPIELQLPKTTVLLEQDHVSFSPVTRILNYRLNAQCVLKINNYALQVTFSRKQDVLGQNCVLNDILLLSEIDSVLVSEKSDVEGEFIVKYDQGRSSMAFTSPKRETIVAALQSARSKAQAKNQQKERVIRPSDVPGTLLNMALLNMGSDDQQLRESAYNLLCILSLIFNFDVGNHLLAAKGLSIPGNNTNFITKISEKLAATAGHLTLEFLKECFVGFTKSSTELKHLCLEYMAPWLPNLTIIHEANPNDQAAVREQVNEILKMLMDMTVKEAEMYPSVQSKVWQTIGSVEEIMNVTLDTFVTYALEHGLGSKESEVIADTCVTLASANVHLVSGRIIARLRRAIQNTSSKSISSVVEHASWNEMCVLIRFCLMLSFNNRLHVQQYLPELFHIICTVVATGPSLIRVSVYGLLINTVQSLCTSTSLKPQQLISLRVLLNEFSEMKFRLLFGINRGSVDAFMITPEGLKDNADKLPLNSLETVVNYMLEVIDVGSVSADAAGVWRARWMSLAVNCAFQFNPALQSRAFVALGCLSRGDIDDDLMFQILATLRRALMFFDENDCNLIISIIMCLTSIVENSPYESRYLRDLFWIGISLSAIGHPPLFLPALELVQAALRNLDQKNAFAEEPSVVLLKARDQLATVMDQMDVAIGVDFKSDFGFALATVLQKGLRSSTTKSVTIGTFALLIDITMKYIGSTQGILDSSDHCLLGYVDSRVVPYVAPLLSVVESGELRELLWMAGVSNESIIETPQQQQFGFSKHVVSPESVTKSNYPFIYHLLKVPDEKCAVLLVSTMLCMLENAEHENECLFLYNFLAECASAIPDTMMALQDRLLPKMVSVLGSSHVSHIIDAACRILQTLSSTRQESIMLNSPSDVYELHDTVPSPTTHHSGSSLMSRSLTMRSSKKRLSSSLANAVFPAAITSSTSSADEQHLKESKKSIVTDLGFSALSANDCGNFSSVPRSKKYSMSNIASQILGSLLEL